jgi:hypothetical protein
LEANVHLHCLPVPVRVVVFDLVAGDACSHCSIEAAPDGVPRSLIPSLLFLGNGTTPLR